MMASKEHGTSKLGMLFSSLGIVFFAALVLLIWTPFSAVKQPSTHAGPKTFARFGYSESSNDILPGTIAASTQWTYTVNRPLLLSSEADGRVFAVSIGSTWPEDQYGILYALGAAHGRLLWEQHFDNWVMTQPVVANSVVYVGSGNEVFNAIESSRVLTLSSRHIVRGVGSNAIYAINAKTGQIIWKRATLGEDMPTFVYQNGQIFVANGDGIVLDLNAKTGKEIWGAPIGSYVSMASPVIVGSTLIVSGAHPYAMYGINIHTGKIIFKHRFYHVIAGLDDSSLAAHNNMIYTTSTIGSWTDPQVKVIAVNTSGTLIWTKIMQAPKPVGHLPLNIEVGAPVYAHGMVFIGSPITNDEVAFNARTGAVVWNDALSSPVSSAVLVAHGTVIALTQTGEVFAINAATGRILKVTNLGGVYTSMSPMLLDHTLYLTNKSGYVTALPWNKVAP